MPDTTDAALSPAEPADLTDYRPLSTPAVLGLVLAVVSAVVLVTPWLSWLPPLAVALSWWGYRDVRRSPDSKTGSGVAAAGLAIGLAMFAAGVGRGMTAQSLHAQGAEPLAERFLELLAEGDTIGAHQLTLPHPERAATREAAEEYYEFAAEAAESLRGFRSQTWVGRLTGPDAPRPTLVERGPASRVLGGSLVTDWVYELPGAGATPTQRFELRMRRRSSPLGGVASWQVGTLRAADG